MFRGFYILRCHAVEVAALGFAREMGERRRHERHESGAQRLWSTALAWQRGSLAYGWRRWRDLVDHARNGRLERSRARLSAMADTAAETKETLAANMRENADLRKRVAALQDAAAAAAESAAADAAAADKAGASASAALDAARTQREELQGDLGRLQERVAATGDAVDALKSSLAAAREEATAAQGEVEQLNDKLAKAGEALVATRERVTQLRDTLSAVVERQRQTLAAAEATAAELVAERARATEAAGREAHLRAELAASAAAAAGAEAGVARRQEDARATIGHLEAALEAAGKRAENAEERYRTTTAVLKETYTASNEERLRATHSAAELEVRAKETASTVRRLREDLARLKAANQGLRSALGEATAAARASAATHAGELLAIRGELQKCAAVKAQHELRIGTLRGDLAKCQARSEGGTARVRELERQLAASEDSRASRERAQRRTVHRVLAAATSCAEASIDQHESFQEEVAERSRENADLAALLAEQDRASAAGQAHAAVERDLRNQNKCLWSALKRTRGDLKRFLQLELQEEEAQAASLESLLVNEFGDDRESLASPPATMGASVAGRPAVAPSAATVRRAVSFLSMASVVASGDDDTGDDDEDAANAAGASS